MNIPISQKIDATCQPHSFVDKAKKNVSTIFNIKNQPNCGNVHDKAHVEFKNFQEGIEATFWQIKFYATLKHLRLAIRFLSGKIAAIFHKIFSNKISTGFDSAIFKEWNPNKISLGIESEKKMSPYELAGNLGFNKDPKWIANELNNVPNRVFENHLYKGEEEGANSEESRLAFREELGLNNSNVNTLITPFTKAFSLNAGVEEGYSIGTHSIMVVRMFDQHLEYKFAKINHIISLAEFRLFLMLHDIGKGLATEEEGQIDSTERKCKELRYCQEAIDQLVAKGIIELNKGRIFKALLHDVTIGKLLTHKINIEQAKTELNLAMKEYQLEGVISKKDFFCLHKVFHMADASAYKAIRRLGLLFEVDSVSRKMRYVRSSNPESAGIKLRALKAQFLA